MVTAPTSIDLPPVFVTVNFCSGEKLPLGTLPKSNVAGTSRGFAGGGSPKPSREIVCVCCVPPASWVNSRLAVYRRAASGRNATSIVHDEPASTLAPHVVWDGNRSVLLFVIWPR